MAIEYWTCKCGRTSVANKKKCRCGKLKPAYEMKTATQTVRTDITDTDALKDKLKKEYDKKQSDINSAIPVSTDDSLLHSTMHRRKKR